jgi:hypothetical protein
MYIPKRYGLSKVDVCPFCGKHATAKNDQDIPVCQQHRQRRIQQWTCACGEPLDLLQGKFGAYFSCINCGNISFAKAFEMNASRIPTLQEKPKETTIRSDEL